MAAKSASRRLGSKRTMATAHESRQKDRNPYVCRDVLDHDGTARGLDLSQQLCELRVLLIHKFNRAASRPAGGLPKRPGVSFDHLAKPVKNGLVNSIAGSEASRTSA